VKRLLAHLVGDDLLHTHYEAVEKTNSWTPAVTHAAKYTAAFLPLTRNPKALAVIGGTHLILDHYRLAKHVNWLRNQAAPQLYRADNLQNAGSPQAVPPGLAMALMFITDNTIHMLINEWALDRYET
jgi:hypothetical protein